MIDKQNTIDFFDSLAPSWDETTCKEVWKIDKILTLAGICAGKTVLDVACGTGVLLSDYLRRNIASCTAVDISPQMVQIASQKFKQHDNIRIRVADAEHFTCEQKFDCIVIYNAFPHFGNRIQLFKNLVNLLKPNGRITVAHSMSRKTINTHHSGSASAVSLTLPEAKALAKLMQSFFTIDTCISDDEMYVVSGTI